MLEKQRTNTYFWISKTECSEQMPEAENTRISTILVPASLSDEPEIEPNMSYEILYTEADDSSLFSEDGDNATQRPRADEPKVVYPAAVPRRPVIIEPVLAMYFIAWLPGMTLQGQFILDQMSAKNNLSSYETGNNNTPGKSCGKVDLNSSYFHVQQKSQEDAAQFSIYLDSISSTVQLLAVIIYGALSDKLGRRVPMILPLIGGAIRYLAFVLVIVLKLPLQLLLLGGILEAVLGGQSTILMAAFAYIADITTQKNRTLKITIAEIACGAASAAAQVTIGFLANYTGYLYPYFFLLGFHVSNCIYVIFFVPETRKQRGKVNLKSIFSVHKHFAAAVGVYTKDDKTGRRGSLLIILPALFLFGLVLTGRLAPQTLYLMNTPFCWTSIQLGIYMAIFALCTNAGQIISYALFYKRLGDVGVGLKGALSCAVSLVLMAFATKGWLIYLVAVIGYGSTLPIPVLRSLMSKITSPNEQGVLFASVSGIETLTSLVASLVFNPIYEKTLYFMPGFVFLVMAGLELLGIFLLVIFICRQRRLRKSDNEDKLSIVYNEDEDNFAAQT